MKRWEPSILIVLLKGCDLGNPGQRVRVSEKVAISACTKGLARIWEPPSRVQKVKPDVVKQCPN